ncbi:MAG: monofunctional biosynthetic peptidoglycan transglycosylase [Pseudomonadota bacterium]
MAKRSTKKKPSPLRRASQTVRRWLWRGVGVGIVLTIIWVAAYRVLPVPTTPYIWSEGTRLGPVERDWVPIEDISPNLQRAVVAAEDANFCLHWGFDMTAIRAVIDAGASRGASTISQQTVKNAFLWHGRSWFRKALEAGITPIMELLWPKTRVLEVYLNVAEFDEGVFGAEAAARHHFGVSASDLTLRQASLLAAVLPAPQVRSASAPSDWVSRRAQSIADGAETIRADGRDECFAN